MKEYVIEIMGSEDSTKVTLGLTPTQAALIKRIADLVNSEAMTICKPMIEITERK
jgi:hypothetical protein